MPQLFVPLGGGFQKAAGSGFNTFGENLDRPQWQGAELGFLDTFPDVLGAVSEAEFHDWIIGVHHPLFIDKGPPWCRFLDADPAERAHALDVAATSATAAHHLGARYILFHFPWPYLSVPGRRYEDDGWYFHQIQSVPQAHWSEDAMFEASRRVFDRLAEVQAQEAIRVIFEIDGPNPYFFDGELYSRLFEEFPDLSLCVDTGRLILLGRTYNQDPVAMAKRWLPWTRHLHLHDSFWDENGQFHNHVPVKSTGPAAEIARMVLEAQPRASVVLEHDPRTVSPEALEATHTWTLDLVRRRD